MSYSELIKDFSKIRDYLRQFYVYGFKSRMEYTAKSARTYDNERKRIESWLGGYMRSTKSANGKSVFLAVDSRVIAHNPLYRAFKAKSFTDNDIMLHFFLLDILVAGERFTASGVQERLYEEYLSCFDDYCEPSLDIIRKKLNEYVALGLLRSEKCGNKLLYERAESAVQLARWQQALAFFSEVLPLGVVGSTLLDKLDCYQDEEFGTFAFKHNYILHALDSEVFYQLLNALNAQTKLLATCVSSKNKEYNVTMLPLRFYISTQTGRQYIVCWHYEWQRLVPLRIDCIKKLKTLAVEPKFDEYIKAYETSRKYLWGISYGNGRNVEHIEMVVHVAPHEDYIRQRLLREARCGEVVQLDDTHYKYSADVYDAGELLPWVRSYICRIESFTCSNKQVEERFYADLEAMYAVYDLDDEGASKAKKVFISEASLNSYSFTSFNTSETLRDSRSFISPDMSKTNAEGVK